MTEECYPECLTPTYSLLSEKHFWLHILPKSTSWYLVRKPCSRLGALPYPFLRHPIPLCTSTLPAAFLVLTMSSCGTPKLLHWWDRRQSCAKIYEDAYGAIGLPSCRYVIVLQKVLWPTVGMSQVILPWLIKEIPFLSKRGGWLKSHYEQSWLVFFSCGWWLWLLVKGNGSKAGYRLYRAYILKFWVCQTQLMQTRLVQFLSLCFHWSAFILDGL